MNPTFVLLDFRRQSYLACFMIFCSILKYSGRVFFHVLSATLSEFV